MITLKYSGVIVMKLLVKIIAGVTLCSVAYQALACSDIFVNKGGYHIEGRTMDLALNISHNEAFYFVGQKNTSDVVVDADKIPVNQLASWTNKYGYWGRNAFNTPLITDGMNTQGLSVALQTMIAKYPTYNPADKRPVLSVFELGNYVLSQAKDVPEALKLLQSRQLVTAAIKVKDGTYIKDIPVHFSLRDSKGNSAVIEFMDGKIQIYNSAGNVMTNDPAYPQQLANAEKYKNINSKIDNNTLLKGVPGSLTSLDRFVRSDVLLNSLPKPDSLSEALYQTDLVLSSLSYYPAYNNKEAGGATIWRVIKDLDNKVVYTSNLVYYQGGNKIAPTALSNRNYTVIDLKQIDFNQIPEEYQNMVFKPTPKVDVKFLASAAQAMPSLVFTEEARK